MVSFELSEEQRLLKDLLAGFAAEEMRPIARGADESGVVPETFTRKAAELGLVTSAIPEAHGGYGDARSALTGAIALEELGWGDLALALHVLAPRLIVYPLIDHGTEEQRARVLPAFAAGAPRAGSSALIEPFLDFDLGALRTTFRREGSGVLLRGRKAFVPLAAEAETILVYARDESAPAAASPLEAARAVQGFLVERGARGLAVGEREKNLGIHALATHELELDDVAVPYEARVGGERGIDFARLANLSRVALGALAVGVARAAFDHARAYAKERRAFGVAIAQKQAIAFLLAEMAIEIDAARLLVWQAAWRLDRGEESTRAAVLAKTSAATTALRVADDAVQVLGGHGYVRDHPVELYLRNARGFAAFEGLAIV
jgi:acyl-CoA dehydrogenase